MCAARLVALALMLGAAASCAPQPRQACTAGPDGAPLADRGIGGTGIDGAGTGVDHGPSRQADRGIGGTGVVGVVTGFGSVCVDGLEIGIAGARIDVDGAPATPAVLRAGQVVAVRAWGDMLAAETVTVRHAVIGPVDFVSDEALVVAGQSVVTRSLDFPPRHRPRPGEWIAVSGLPRPDGRISGTRIDPAPSGLLLVRGRALRDGDRLRVGALPIPSGEIAAGAFVVARGTAGPAGLIVGSVEPDPIAENPLHYFGPGVARLVLQAYMVAGPNGLSLAGGPTLPTVPGVAPVVGMPQVAVILSGPGFPAANLAAGLPSFGAASAGLTSVTPASGGLPASVTGPPGGLPGGAPQIVGLGIFGAAGIAGLPFPGSPGGGGALSGASPTGLSPRGGLVQPTPPLHGLIHGLPGFGPAMHR